MQRLSQGVVVLLIICTICTAIFAFGNFDESVDTLVLKEGARGEEVKKVQSKLKEYGYYYGNIDGIYGSATKTAVKKFQQAKGLAVDGIVGKNTLNALGLSSLTTSSSSNTSYNESDVYLLAKCIYAEARGEPYTGKVAVGAVVLNRVKSPDFPNSIAGVIYQPWAFTAVNDGQINLEPDESAKRAAKDAMSGWDPTNGCIYYYNPAKTTNKWIWSREVRVVIGSHRFAV